MKKILIIVVLLSSSSCHQTIIEDRTLDTYAIISLLNDSSTFQEYLKKLNFDSSLDDYATKRKKILTAISDYFWHNTFSKDYIGPNNPGVVGVFYEKEYGEFDLYCIYQSDAWFANNDESITSIEHKQDYYIAYSINDEPMLSFSKRLDSTYSPQRMCINEISYYLAIKDNPFKYYAIANVFESERVVIDFIDSLGSREGKVDNCKYANR